MLSAGFLLYISRCSLSVLCMLSPMTSLRVLESRGLAPIISKFIIRHMLLSALPMLLGSSVANRPIKLSLEAETTASVVRSLSAVSLMFIIMVTPWAILQVSTSKSEP